MADETFIERVTVSPKTRTHATPILFLHGMWHGAWCWADWQRILAERGWESTAISLPGHGASGQAKPVSKMTMEDYLAVVAAEVAAYETPPIVIGHSMGGAFIQWYLKKVADDLPAVVLVASWTAHSTIADGTWAHLKRDPVGFFRMGVTSSCMPLVRSPKWAASLLITKDAILSPEALHAKLCEESGLVLSQHNPPAWTPKPDLKTPMLWLAAEKDAVITLKGAKVSADFYGADFQVVASAAHNLMMEKSYVATADAIDAWLSGKGL